MQTILGANGQIAEELAKELHRNYTQDIRLVSRNPKKVNSTDQVFSADLMDSKATEKAVEGSEIAYLTVGLPMNSAMWEERFPVMMRNVIDACIKYKVKLVFFDNTYMYPKNAIPQTEETPFTPVGRKASVRAIIAEMLLTEMATKAIEAVICRAPEFYGPNKTQSITNTLIFDNLAKGKQPKVPLKDNTKRSLIWTPDASKAMALIGNTPDAYHQTWHLPCDDNRMNYRELVQTASKEFNQGSTYSVISMLKFRIGSLFNKQINELMELLPNTNTTTCFYLTNSKSTSPTLK